MGVACNCLLKYKISPLSVPSTCLIPLYVLLSSCHALPNKFFQLELSSIVLEGHCNSVNAVKFDADLSMLLSGGKSFICLPFHCLTTLPHIFLPHYTLFCQPAQCHETPQTLHMHQSLTTWFLLCFFSAQHT